jgi:glycosyltransferase involved in cell wall biosynthesis
MKIAITAYCCDPRRGTEFGLGWGWASAYALRGHDVTVITSRDAISRQGRDTARMGGNMPRGLTVVELAEEVVDSISSPEGLEGMISFHRRYQKWIGEASRYLARRTFDVVQHVSGGSVQGGSPLAEANARAVVFGPVGGGQHAPWQSIPQFGRSKGSEIVRTALWVPARGRRRRLSRSFENIDLGLATNVATADFMRRLGVGNVTMMLADGIDSGAIDHPLGTNARRRGPGPLRLAWVGKLAPRKGIHTLLQAAGELHRRQFPFTLDIVGDGVMMPEVQAAIHHGGLGDCVQAVGHVPHDEVVTLFDKADAHLFTSWRDSSGVQCLEAWGRGVPTIYLDLHGIGDFGPGAGGVPVAPFPASSAHLRLADAVEVFPADEEAMKTRSDLALRFARQQSWSAKAARVEAALSGASVERADQDRALLALRGRSRVPVSDRQLDRSAS